MIEKLKMVLYRQQGVIKDKNLILQEVTKQDSKQVKEKLIYKPDQNSQSKHLSNLQMQRQLPLLQLVNSLLPSPLITLQPLQPDRPASSYQLSYTKFHEQQLSNKLSQTQISQLLNQVSDLNNQLTISKTLNKRKQSEYHQKLLLMNIQVQRVRSIMRQQGHTIQKAKHEWSQLQSIYMLKLQQTKIHLARQFQEQLKNKTHESSTIIQQVRQLYIEKIASITEEYEKQLKHKDYQSSNQQQHQVKLQIYEMKEQELQNRVQVLVKENLRLQKDVFMTRKQLQDQRANHMANGTASIMNAMNFNPLSNGYNNSNSTNLNSSNLHVFQIQQLRSHIKQTSHKLQNQLSRLQHELKTKDEQLQMMKWKYHKLEQQLSEFKNRKTTSNMPQSNEKNKKTLFFNNLRIQKQQQQPRRQTQERISYQQSLKKLHQLQMKVDQLNTQIIKKDQVIEEQLDQLDDKTMQLNAFKKTLLEKENTIKQLMQQLTETSKKDHIKDPIDVSNKKEALALIQKDQLIFSLKEQIQKKQSLLNKQQKDITKLQKEIQKLNKKQKELQHKLIENDENYATRLKAKDNQIKAKQSDIKVKESQIRLKESQFKSKDSLVKALQAQIKELKCRQSSLKPKQLQSRQFKAKQTQLKLTNQQLKHLNEQNKSLKEQIRKKNQQLQQAKQQIKNLIQQVTSKNQQLHQKQQQLMALQEKTKHHIPFYDQIHPKAPQTQRKKKSAIPDPFADPFVDSDDANDNHQVEILVGKKSDNQTTLNHYEQKITELQAIVQQLQFDWGQTEQNQNAIFTYTKAAFSDQVKALKDQLQEKEKTKTAFIEEIKALKDKLQEKEKLAAGLQQLLNLQLKKNHNDQQSRKNKSKEKYKK